MKKIIFSAVIAFAATISGGAQTVTKPVVNVQSFEYSQAFGTAEVEVIRNNVISSLQATNRIIIVDLEQQDAVKSEANRRKDEGAMNDDHSVADITQLNANYLLKGMLNSINTTESKSTDKDGKVSYSWKTKLEYTLQLIDPSTGATVYSNTYSSSGSSSSGSSESRKKAVSGSSASMKSFIEAAFPVRGTILAVKDIDTKKNVAKTVYINLGNDHGIQVGQKFSVYAVVDIAGEKSETEIGTVTAAEVMSGSRTLCKVNKGGDVVLQKLNAKEEMSIKTREVRTFLDKINI